LNKPQNTLRVIAAQRTDDQPLEHAIQQAVQKAEANAKNTAAALGMRLLGLAAQKQEIFRDEAGRPLEARAEMEYFVSDFRQALLDLKLLAASGNWFALVKKELATRWFRFQMGLRTRNTTRPVSSPAHPRALVAGHFSLPGGRGTFGDVEAMEVVCAWLDETGIPYDVASNSEDGVTGPGLLEIDPAKYSIFIFVCGPWYPRKKIHALLLRQFAHCLKIGVNLTVAEAGNAGFDALLARDNPQQHRADLAFARQLERLPVVGVLLVERQAAYGSKQRHLYVKKVFEEYLSSGKVVPLHFDTVIYGNKVGLTSGPAFESLLRKVDVLITNRLHGLVLGLKNNLPVVAVDSVAGGGKVSAQANALGWPVLIPVEELSVETLDETVKKCLSQDMLPILETVHSQAGTSLAQTKTGFLELLPTPESPSTNNE
jgi:hypothetical protein